MAFKAKPLCSDKDIYGEGLTSNNLALQEYDDNVRDLEGAERKENTQKSGKEITRVLNCDTHAELVLGTWKDWKRKEDKQKSGKEITHVDE
jgi:hypothetical protein